MCTYNCDLAGVGLSALADTTTDNKTRRYPTHTEKISTHTTQKRDEKCSGHTYYTQQTHTWCVCVHGRTPREGRDLDGDKLELCGWMNRNGTTVSSAHSFPFFSFFLSVFFFLSAGRVGPFSRAFRVAAKIAYHSSRSSLKTREEGNLNWLL